MPRLATGVQIHSNVQALVPLSDSQPTAEKPNLLVVELWGLGDLVIGSSFLQAASQKFQITLLAKPYAEDLRARFWPEVKVVPFLAPWTAFRHKYRLFSWPWREIYRLRPLAAHGFSAGLSARSDPRDHIVLRALRVKRRLGFSRLGSRFLLTEALVKPERGVHRYEYWRVLGRALGLTLPTREQLPIPPPRRSTVVLVHTGAGQPIRVWPLDRYRRLVVRMRREGHQVQVACDADQRGWWRTVGEDEVATPRTVGELLALIDRAGAFIGNDSGPGHLAAACGIRTLTFFGPQLPQLFVPLHPAADWLEGKPCPYKPCSDYCRFMSPHCLWGLSEEEVWLRVQAFLGSGAALPPAQTPALQSH